MNGQDQRLQLRCPSIPSIAGWVVSLIRQTMCFESECEESFKRASHLLLGVEYSFGKLQNCITQAGAVPVAAAGRGIHKFRYTQPMNVLQC